MDERSQLILKSKLKLWREVYMYELSEGSSPLTAASRANTAVSKHDDYFGRQ